MRTRPVAAPLREGTARSEFESVDIDHHVHRAVPDLHDSLDFRPIIRGRLLSRCDFRGKDFDTLHYYKGVARLREEHDPPRDKETRLPLPRTVSALHFLGERRSVRNSRSTELARY